MVGKESTAIVDFTLHEKSIVVVIIVPYHDVELSHQFDNQHTRLCYVVFQLDHYFISSILN